MICLPYAGKALFRDVRFIEQPEPDKCQHNRSPKPRYLFRFTIRFRFLSKDTAWCDNRSNFFWALQSFAAYAHFSKGTPLSVRRSLPRNRSSVVRSFPEHVYNCSCPVTWYTTGTGVCRQRQEPTGRGSASRSIFSGGSGRFRVSEIFIF